MFRELLKILFVGFVVMIKERQPLIFIILTLLINSIVYVIIGNILYGLFYLTDYEMGHLVSEQGTVVSHSIFPIHKETRYSYSGKIMVPREVLVDNAFNLVIDTDHHGRQTGSFDQHIYVCLQDGDLVTVQGIVYGLTKTYSIESVVSAKGCD